MKNRFFRRWNLDRLEDRCNPSSVSAYDHVAPELARLLETGSTNGLQVDAQQRVVVRVTSADLHATLPPLRALGYDSHGDSPDLFMTEGWLPISALPAAEALGDAGLLRGVIGIFAPTTEAGNVTSAAVDVVGSLRANAAATPFTGAGVKVGIISDSFDTVAIPVSGPNTGWAADKANGEVPSSLFLNQDAASGVDEGRAMIQLVYDIAPGAQMGFAAAGNSETAMAAAITALASAGANIIVDDIPFPEEPMFQPGKIGQAYQAAKNSGVVGIMSGGNRGLNATQSVGFPGTTDGYQPGSTFLNFNPGGAADARCTVSIPGNSQATFVVQWDDPFFLSGGVKSNIDIYVVQSGSNVLVTSSTRDNPNMDFPSEIVTINTTGGPAASAEILIRLVSGPAPSRVYLKATNTAPTMEYNGAPTTTGRAGSVLAIAASSYYNQETPDSYSSPGPTTHYFNAAGTRYGSPIVYNKPDVIAPVGTNTTFYQATNPPASFYSDDANDPDTNLGNFYGTSAAAPIVAGIAALLKQKNPSWTPIQIGDAITASARDLGPNVGWDAATGFGLVDAWKALFGSPVPASVPYTNNFESGALDNAWNVKSNGHGRVHIFNAGGGTKALTLDGFFFQNPDSYNEANFHVNAQVVGATLKFDARSFDDESDPVDGVLFSVDGGANFFTLLPGSSILSGGWTPYSFDLNAEAAKHGVTLSTDTIIRFQQFDNSSTDSTPSEKDGFAFDNVSVTSSTPFPDKFWDGGALDDLWSSPANWVGNTLPTANSRVQINSGYNVVVDGGTAKSVYSYSPLTVTGEITLSQASHTYSTFTLATNGYISGGSITPHANMTWTGGEFRNATLNVLSGQTVTVSGPDPKYLLSATLDNSGTIAWTSGNIHAGNSTPTNVGGLVNRAGGTFRIEGDVDWLFYNGWFGPALTLQHLPDATFLRQTDGGDTEIAGVLDFQEDVTIASGSITANGGGKLNNFNLTGTLNLTAGTYTTANTTSVTGPGKLVVNGGTLTVTAGQTATFANLDLATNGTLNGLGTVTVTGIGRWSGGSMLDAGTTAFPAGSSLFIESADPKFMLDRFVSTAGATTWTGGNIFSGNSTPTPTGGWTAKSGSQTNITGSVDWVFYNGWFGPTLSFTLQSNATLSRSSSSDSVEFAGAFNSNGKITVSTGELLLTGGGDWKTTEFVSGSIRMNSGTYTASGSTTGSGIVTVDGGTLTTAAAATFNHLNLATNGTWSGTGLLTIAGTSKWTGGSMIDAGTTAFGTGSSLTISTLDPKFMLDRFVTNAGAVSWTGGLIFSGNSTTTPTGGWINTSGSQFLSTSDADWLFYNGWFGPTLPFTVQFNSRYDRLGGSGTTEFAGAFNSYGKLNIASGNMSATGGGFWGSTELLAGTVRLSAGTFTLLPGTTTTGSGVMSVDGGTLTIGATHTATLRHVDLSLNGEITGAGDITITGTSLWTGGTVKDSGKTIFANGSNLHIQGTSPKYILDRRIDIHGNATWSGGDVFAGETTPTPTSAVTLKTGATFTVTGNGDWLLYSGYFGPPTPFRMEANSTFNRTTGTGEVIFAGAFHTAGTVTIASGSVTLQGGGSLGTTSIPQGTLYISAGLFDLVNGAAVTGNGSLTLDGGTTESDDLESFFVDNIIMGNVSAGGLYSSGDVQVNKSLSWLGGTIGGTGALDLAAGSVTTISGTSPHTLLDRTVYNAGTVTWSGGAMHSGSTSPSAYGVWFNTSGGTFDITGNTTWSQAAGWFGPVTPITNLTGGTMKRSMATGTATIDGVVTNNGGTTRVSTGTLVTAGDFVQTGGLLDVISTFDPAGDVNVLGGLVGGVGKITSAVDLSGGTLEPAGTAIGTLTITGNYTQDGTLDIELLGTAVNLYDRLKVNGSVTLNGPLTVDLDYAAKVGDNFLIVENDGSDTISGTFTGLAQGDTFLAGGAKFQVSYTGGTGNDTTLTVLNVVPDVTSFSVNDGAAQRSRLTKVVVNFASPIDLAVFTGANQVFFTRTGIPTSNIGAIGTVVNNASGLVIAAGPTANDLTLTFANIDNDGIDYGSLADGRWQLTITPANYTSPNGPTDTQLRRLFGNVDNDTTVGATDFGFFPPFGTLAGNPFDFDNSGDVGGGDFGEFGNRFGFTLV